MTGRILNCTPHRIVWAYGPTMEIRFEPCGVVPRVKTISTPVPGRTGVVTQQPGPVEGLPDQVDDRILIVSKIVFDAAPADRTDLLAPDTGPESAIRDEAGNIAAVKRMIARTVTESDL